MRRVAGCRKCMRNACMPAITIRNVPQETRDVLAARAAAAGQSLQEYLFAELERMAGSPTIDEWISRLEHRRAPAPEPAIGHDEIVDWIDDGRRGP